MYATAEQMGRFQGERLTGMTDTYSWEPATRIARFVGTQDSALVRKFRGNTWARIVQDKADYYYWLAAEGRIGISAPSQPGDETEQEIRATTEYFRWAERELEEWETALTFPPVPVHNLVVVRLHVTRTYGAFRPEDELDEWVEPMYW
ncbi:hypothetical protein OG361_30665 [Streptomyces sp. NBC_00090]|uniref:hypothetical protein n=1 Tax=Streptomyces sp. NBC_00090 TaxID=2903619 RepID=UPI0032497519